MYVQTLVENISLDNHKFNTFKYKEKAKICSSFSCKHKKCKFNVVKNCINIAFFPLELRIPFYLKNHC